MPSLRSGTPLVSSPASGNHPRQARPPLAMAMAAFSSSGRAKNSCAAASSRSNSATSMPWPVTEKNPWSRQARSIEAGASGSRRSMTGTVATSGGYEVDTVYKMVDSVYMTRGTSREHLIETARAYLDEHGLEGLTLREV